jgi:hypothetical protein
MAHPFNVYPKWQRWLDGLLFSVLAAAAAFCLLKGFKTYGQPLPTPRPQPFYVGAWQVPVEDVSKWQGRGVDAFVCHVDYGGRMSKAEWEQRVTASGGRVVTYPGDDIASEAKQPGRVGFLQKDEPDMVNHVDKPGYTPPEFRTQWERAKATGVPMWLTCGAIDNQWYDGTPKPQKTDGSKYGHRAENFGWYAWCDVAGFDWYIYTGGRTEAIGFPVIERCLDRVWEWSGHKPIYLFVETSTQGNPYAMTADQWESQVMHAANYCKARGYNLRGIIYFSHKVFPVWRAFDNTSPEVAARMPRVNATLRQMFNAPMPATRPATQPATAPAPAEDPELVAARGQIAALEARQAELLRNQDEAVRALQRPATQPTR